MAEAISSDQKIKTDLPASQPILTTNDENTTLLSFDPNIGSREDTKQQLRLINDYVIFHTNLSSYITFIRSIDKETMFLIPVIV